MSNYSGQPVRHQAVRHQPPGPQPAGKPTVRLTRRGRATIIVMVLLVGLVAAGVIVQLSRALPASVVTVSLPASYTIPGSAPKMPWPSTGEASVEVLGIGSLGAAGGTRPAPIASTAKMMTAYVILTDHPLTVNAAGPAITVTAADVADYRADVAANDSATRVALGEKLTERQALEALLIPSADNIARMLATWDAGNSEAFLDKMNAAATKLGMSNTTYTDPSGLDATTTSTAVDQIKLAEKVIALPAFAKIVAMKHVTLPVAGTVKNYNSLLGKDGIVGIKTGSTSAAGGCLIFVAHRTVAGHTYTIIGAVLGQDVGGDTAHQLPIVTAASRKIVQAASAALVAYPIIRRGQTVADLRGPLGAHTSVVAGADISAIGWPGLTYQMSTDVPVTRKALAGANLGTIRVTGHQTATSAPALSQTRIDPPTIHQRLIRPL
jgi:serine-type D-Ala-D-Ala carboxypeptidase (penicillin-binding protein 5/6)